VILGGKAGAPDQKGKRKRAKVRQFLGFFNSPTLWKGDHFLFIGCHPVKILGTANFDQSDKFLTSCLNVRV
jgi:hypothetical protein